MSRTGPLPIGLGCLAESELDVGPFGIPFAVQLEIQPSCNQSYSSDYCRGSSRCDSSHESKVALQFGHPHVASPFSNQNVSSLLLPLTALYSETVDPQPQSLMPTREPVPGVSQSILSGADQGDSHS